MKTVKSFSLSSEVIEAIDEIPRNDRSRKINEILREALLGETGQKVVSREELRAVIQEVMSGVKVESNEDKTQEALGSIISMRKG